MSTARNVQLLMINCQIDEFEKIEIQTKAQDVLKDLPGEIETQITVSQNDKTEYVFEISARYNRGHIAISKNGLVFEQVKKETFSDFESALMTHRSQLEVETFRFDKTGEYDYYTEVSTESSVKPPRPLRTLILEDDPAAATILKSTLRSLGCQSEHFDLPDKALKALNQKRYDLIVLDWNLPYMKGSEFLVEAEKLLKADDLEGQPLRQIPVVICTSLPLNEIQIPPVTHFTFYNHWHKSLPFSSVFGSVDETTRRVMKRNQIQPVVAA